MGMHRVSFVSYALGGGGAERVTSLLANFFADKGIETSILILNNLPAGKEYPLHNSVFVTRANLNDLNRVKYIYKRRKVINDFVASQRPDIVIALNGARQADYLGTVLLSKVPFIASKRNCEPQDFSFHSWCMSKIERYVFHHANGVVFQTPDQKNMFDELIQGKSCIIPNPLSVDNLPTASRTECRIVSFGRLEHQKRFDILIKAFALVHAKHPEYVLDIFGDGSQRESLQNLAIEEQVAETVHFRPFSNKIHDEIASAKVYVNSSDYEGLSNALLEALAMGLPVIATDSYGGGSRLALSEGGGILVPKADVQAMADALGRVIEDEGIGWRLSGEARITAKRFDTQIVCERWFDYAKHVYEMSVSTC